MSNKQTLKNLIDECPFDTDGYYTSLALDDGRNVSVHYALESNDDEMIMCAIDLISQCMKLHSGELVPEYVF